MDLNPRPNIISNKIEGGCMKVSYGKFIRLCVEKDVTPMDVVRDTGVDGSIIQQWKQSGVLTDEGVAQKISYYFDVSPSYFGFTGETGTQGFYEQLRKACKLRDVSVSKAAEDIGLNRSSATNWKNGSLPSIKIVYKFSEYLGVSVDYLLGMSGLEDNEYERNALLGELVGRLYHMSYDDLKSVNHMMYNLYKEKWDRGVSNETV